MVGGWTRVVEAIMIDHNVDISSKSSDEVGDRWKRPILIFRANIENLSVEYPTFLYYKLWGMKNN